MIGFTLSATSNIGFTRTGGAWTEGSLWLAEKALSKFAPQGADMFSPDLLGAIEERFSDLRKILLNRIGGIENLFWMNMTGSILMSMKFDPETPANIKVWRLLKDISLNNVEVGDQVMIQICKCITDFDDYVGVKNSYGGLTTTPILTIEVQL